MKVSYNRQLSWPRRENCRRFTIFGKYEKEHECKSRDKERDRGEVEVHEGKAKGTN